MTSFWRTDKPKPVTDNHPRCVHLHVRCRPTGVRIIGKVLELRRKGTVIWYDSTAIETMEPRLFEFDWLRAKSHLRGSSQGRGNAHYLHFAGRDLVLRPFHRGGLIGKFNRDRYFYARVGDSRAMREFMLLNWMRTQGLPVPWPVAARHRASGLFYRADLITERIPNARPLAEVLLECAIQEHSWSRIGTVIRQMHSLGVYHADLNCRNVLLDASERVWLIDFDKCKRRVPGGWMQRNLARLKRSLVKTRRENSDLNWAEQNWAEFLSGYAQSSSLQTKKNCSNKTKPENLRNAP